MADASRGWPPIRGHVRQFASVITDGVLALKTLPGGATDTLILRN